MTRPWIIWSTAVFCALIVLGAVGMVTDITLSLEKKIYIEDEKSKRVEKAMVAMEAYVDSLLARENSRDAEDFSPLQTRINRPKLKSGFEIENGLSPLFNETPDDVNYYWFFEVGNKLPSSLVSSPQFPSWGDLEEYAPNSEAQQNLEENTIKHKKLENILNSNSSWSCNDLTSEKAEQYTQNNLGQASYIAYCVSNRVDQGKVVDSQALKAKLTQAVNDEQLARLSFAQKDEKNTSMNSAVLEKKLRVMSRSNSYGTKGKYKVHNEQSKTVYRSGPELSYSLDNNANFNASGNPSWGKNPYLGSFSGAVVSPFVALWLEDELMLVRNVATDSGSFVQGVWLNKKKVTNDLLELVGAYLPDADLEKVEAEMDLRSLSYSVNDLYGLARLPLRLSLGVIPSELGGVTPMRLNLIIAWTCVILAVFAVTIMFRGVMKLSERRASFVSSVSHELRTPLTTFKLYSEMLADGMVRDPNKRQEYLETLSKESDRLTHMVENVLSFSQIERGKCKREACSLPIADVLRQLDRCFKMRLEDEGMTLENDLTEEQLKTRVKVDATSVDQILTNLVDNAAKYGQNKAQNSVVRLTAEVGGKCLSLRVSDDGNGILKRHQRRLFKAFHKSDVEAAHSKPGVGLGLALCRKLAIAMGGDLLIVKAPEKSSGACFELKLPLG